MRIPSFKSVASSKLKVCGSVFVALLCASAQGQTPVDKTPVLHLSFDNVSGSTVFNDGFGGSAMNGTLYSTANGTATIVSGGKFGNCLQVTGPGSADAACRIANAVVPLNVQAGSAWTVAMWIKTTTQGGTWAYQGDGAWQPNNTTFAMVVNNGSTGNNGPAAGGVRYGQGWQQGTATVDDGNWHQIVFTWDGTTKVQYVDGVVDPWVANGWNNAPGAGNQFWIGGGGPGGEGDGQVGLQGLVDEAYVFNIALTQSDVTQLFNNNTYPHVPVSVTVNPTSGYRGQFVTITATATPASGTVTNATVDLSPFGLSSAMSLVQSSANVFTNSFTVPATAPFAAANVRATVIDTEPLVGSGGASFTVVPLPPTNTIVLADLTNTTAYAYTETSFHFGVTNDAPSAGTFPMTYAWYKNSTLVSTNPMGPDYTFLATSGDDGAQIYAVARVADTNFSSIAVTSAVVTLTVNSGTPVYTNGLKREFFAGATRANVEIGNTGPGVITLVTNADTTGGLGDNYAERYSGFFIAPSSDNYVFFLASDDDCDLFLSTDQSPANKQLIAQESGWSGPDNWQTAGGGGSVVGQKRSDQWSPDGGITIPYVAGIPLVAGQKYYIEAVTHQGGGGANMGITYETMTELGLDPTQPVDGSASRLTAANNNIAVITAPGSDIQPSVQPQTSVTVYEGQTTNFTFIAVSDAEMVPNYQWFIVTSGGSLPGTQLTGQVANGTNLTMSLIPANYNNAQIYCVASTVFGGLSVTSSVATLHVIQSVFEPGWVSEKKWMDVFNIGGAEAGTLGDPTFSCVRAGFLAGLDNPSATVNGNRHDSTIQQIGFFVPPSSGDYVFFITSHDGGNLYLSTDNTAANKRLIAQEAGWSGNFAWNSAGGGGTIISQKRSDQYTNSTSGGIPPYAAGIPLVGGQHYYMEVDHTTSQWGNEQFGVDYRIMSGGTVTAPADGSLPNCDGNVVGLNAIRVSSIAFTQQPADVTDAPIMGYATFSAAGTSDSQYPVESSYGYTITPPTNTLFFQWYTNGTLVAGANSGTLSIGPILPDDNGMQVYCRMRALGYADDSLNPIWTNSQTATLTVTQQAVFEPGWLRVEWWTNSNRGNVESGAAGPANYVYATPKMDAPTGSSLDNYANRVTGFFVPPADDSYVFFLLSDDDSDLFLSTDGTPANKRLIALEAGWSGSAYNWSSTGGGGDVVAQRRSDQFTDPNTGTVPYPSGITMSAGQKYYIEGVHNEGGSGDYFQVTYKSYIDLDPTDPSDTIMSGNVIGMYAPRIPWVAFLQQPTDQSATSGGNPVTFTVSGTNAPTSILVGTTGDPTPVFASPNYLLYQWYKNGTAIPGATSRSYTLPYVLPSDDNAQFMCAIRAFGYADDSLSPIWSNSTPAVLHVTTDTNLPAIAYAAMFQNTNQDPHQIVLDITFNKWMDTTTLSNAANYTVPGATVTGVSVAGNNRTVELQLSAMPSLPLTINVSGVKDLSGNTIASGASASVNTPNLTFSDIGTPGMNGTFGTTGVDPAYPSFIWVTGAGGFIVSAEGSDIYNTVDGCNFGWEQKSGDFDAVVRVVSIGKPDNSAKAGLMVREDLTGGSRQWSVVNDPSSADGILAVDFSGYGGNNIECLVRQTNSGATSGWKNLAGNTPPTYPNAWVRLKRTGSVLDAYSSSDGMSWTHLGSYDTTSTNTTGVLPNMVYLGIATTAHANDSANSLTPPPPYLYYNTAEYADYNSNFVPINRPEMTVTAGAAGTLNISWTPTGGHLESSPAIAGPDANWTTVGTDNPATITIGPGSQFFRVVTP